MHYLFKFALFVICLRGRKTLALRNLESVTDPCLSANVIIELLPVGVITSMPLSKLNESGIGSYEDGPPMFLYCENDIPKFQKTCIKHDQIFHLNPMIGERLLPQFTNYNLSAGLCLQFAPEKPPKAFSYKMAKSLREGTKKYMSGAVKGSALLTLQSWLFYAGGKSKE